MREWVVLGRVRGSRGVRDVVEGSQGGIGSGWTPGSGGGSRRASREAEIEVRRRRAASEDDGVGGD